jgi:hypothetical protein
MLGSGWQNRGQSRPGYAAELEKLKPAKKKLGVVARPSPKAGFPTVKGTHDCTDRSIALTKRRTWWRSVIGAHPHATCPRAKIAHFAAWRFYFKAQRPPSPDRNIDLAVEVRSPRCGCAALGTLVSQFAASEHRSPPRGTFLNLLRLKPSRVAQHRE